MWTGFLQGLLIIIISPILIGWMNWLKACRQGRRRKISYVLQPYWDLHKLFTVPAVQPRSASWIFRVTPSIVFVIYALLAFSVPVFSDPLLAIDLITIIYLLGLARFILSLAGWDTGASFGPMGSNRSMFIHTLTEMGLIFVLATLMLRWNCLDPAKIILEHNKIINNLLQGNSDSDALLDLSLVFLPIALGTILLIELERIPVSNPDSHLELTMSQQAIILEFAGRDLSLITLSEMIKLGFLFALFVDLFIPLKTSHWIGNFLLFPVKMVILSSMMSQFEVSQPRMRLLKTTRLAWVSILFSLIAIALVTFNTFTKSTQ